MIEHEYWRSVVILYSMIIDIAPTCKLDATPAFMAVEFH